MSEETVPKLVQKELLCLMKDIIRKGSVVEVPEDLQEFVELHLDQWIDNALMARVMSVNDDYIIDFDRSEMATRCQPNIVIMDNQTGDLHPAITKCSMSYCTSD